MFRNDFSYNWKRCGTCRRWGLALAVTMSVPAQTSCNVYTPDLLESGDVVTLGGGTGPTSGTPSSPNAFRASPSPSVLSSDAGAGLPDDAAVSEASVTGTDITEAGEATHRRQLED